MASLFLPFTPSGKATELLAIEVKKRLAAGATATIDPHQALPRVPARLVDPREFRSGIPEVARLLFAQYRDEWSGVGFGRSPHDGAWLVLLNPTHAETRQRATLMEEIVHIIRGHPRTLLTVGPDGVSWARSHDAEVEDEAYTVGAACLLPYPALFHAIMDAHETAESIGGRLGVSADYVNFRIKRAGLSRVYQKHCTRRSTRSSCAVK